MNPEPPAILEIHFDGGQVYPEDVPPRALADALAAVQRLVAGAEAPDDGPIEQPSGEAGGLRLVGVRRGSAIYRIAGGLATPAWTNLKVAGSVLDHPDDVQPSADYILSPVKSLSTISRRLGCEITIREPGSQQEMGAVLARIGPASYSTLSQSLLILGQTTLFGRVERVGGATAARCGLRVPSRERMLVCKVSNEKLARQIGTWLYKDVAVSGEARWIKHSLRLFSFTIQSVSRPEQGSILEAIQALRRAGGDAWDLVGNPDEFLEEVRRDS